MWCAGDQIGTSIRDRHRLKSGQARFSSQFRTSIRDRRRLILKHEFGTGDHREFSEFRTGDINASQIRADGICPPATRSRNSNRDSRCLKSRHSIRDLNRDSRCLKSGQAVFPRMAAPEMHFDCRLGQSDPSRDSPIRVSAQMLNGLSTTAIDCPRQRTRQQRPRQHGLPTAASTASSTTLPRSPQA